jgi:hypothetical protein
MRTTGHIPNYTKEVDTAIALSQWAQGRPGGGVSGWSRARWRGPRRGWRGPRRGWRGPRRGWRGPRRGWRGPRRGWRGPRRGWRGGSADVVATAARVSWTWRACSVPYGPLLTWIVRHSPRESGVVAFHHLLAWITGHTPRRRTGVARGPHAAEIQRRHRASPQGPSGCMARQTRPPPRGVAYEPPSGVRHAPHPCTGLGVARYAQWRARGRRTRRVPAPAPPADRAPPPDRRSAAARAAPAGRTAPASTSR